MNSVSLYSKAKLALFVFRPLFYSSYKNLHNGLLTCAGSKGSKLPSLKVRYTNVKYISNYNSMQTKDSDCPTKKVDSEKLQKVLENKEFQSILQDFAKDFDVDDDSNKLLEDIRRDIDKSNADNDVSGEKHSANSDIVPMGSNVDGRYQFKYKEFSDSDSSVIRSYEEQYDPFEDSEKTYHIDQELKPKSLYTDLKRGISGVFDLDELVHVLRCESMLDVTSISIPKELHYADFLVVATAKSERHSEAIAELIKKLYKQKKNKKDRFIKIEGENVANWKAVDMGNIVLHIFLEETRALYDLESLWLLDSTFDSGGSMKVDPMFSILEEQMEFFNSFQQSEATSNNSDQKETNSPKDVS